MEILNAELLVIEQEIEMNPDEGKLYERKGTVLNKIGDITNNIDTYNNALAAFNRAMQLGGDHRCQLQSVQLKITERNAMIYYYDQ